MWWLLGPERAPGSAAAALRLAGCLLVVVVFVWGLLIKQVVFYCLISFSAFAVDVYYQLEGPKAACHSPLPCGVRRGSPALSVGEYTAGISQGEASNLVFL